MPWPSALLAVLCSVVYRKHISCNIIPVMVFKRRFRSTILPYTAKGKWISRTGLCIRSSVFLSKLQLQRRRLQSQRAAPSPRTVVELIAEEEPLCRPLKCRPSQNPTLCKTLCTLQISLMKLLYVQCCCWVSWAVRFFMETLSEYKVQTIAFRF